VSRLFEVSTDKVDSEVPAPVAGVVTEILVPEGDTVEVGTRLAVLGGADESASPPAAPTATPASSPAAETPAPEPVVAAAPAPEPAPAPAPAPEPEPPGWCSPRRGRSRAAGISPARPGARAGRRRTAPHITIVRRLVAERGSTRPHPGQRPGRAPHPQDVLDAAATAATSGPPGRAVAPAPQPEAAVEPAPAPLLPPAAPAPTPAAPTPAPSPRLPHRRPAPSPPAAEPLRAGRALTTRSCLRQHPPPTAEHMVRSKATSGTCTPRLRRHTSGSAGFAPRTSALKEGGFLAHRISRSSPGFCDTVRDFPRVNATVGDRRADRHHDIHLSIAGRPRLSTARRSGDPRRRWQAAPPAAHEIHDLAGSGPHRKLVPDDVLGGTFTITNPGPFGTYATMAIINQPQVAILSTDGKKTTVVVTDRTRRHDCHPPTQGCSCSHGTIVRSTAPTPPRSCVGCARCRAT